MPEGEAGRPRLLFLLLAAACLAIPALTVGTGFAESFRYPKLWTGEALALLAVLLIALKGDPGRLPGRAFGWLIPAVAAAVSLAVAGPTLTGREDLLRLVALALIPIILLSAGDPWRWRWLVLAAAGLNALMAIGQALGWSPPWAGSFTGRFAIYGTFGNPNFLAEYLAPAAVLAMGVWLGNGRARTWGIVMFAVLVGALFLTVSRAAVVGLIIGLLLLFKHVYSAKGWPGVRKGLWSVGLVGLVAALPAAPQIYVRLTSSFGSDPGRSTRFFMWTAAQRIWAAHPVLGAGPGGFGLHYLDEAGKLQTEGGLRPDYVGITSDAHNDALQSLADRGLLGAAAWLLALFLVIRPAWKRRPILTADELLRAGPCLGAAAAILVESLFGFPFRIFPTAALFLWALASLPVPDLNTGTFGRHWPRIMLAAVAIPGLWLLGRTMLADTALAAGRGRPAGEPALREGLSLLPTHGELHFRLGLLLRDRGAVPDATAEFEAALAEFRDPDVYFNLGLINLNQKKYDVAAMWFAEGLKRYPFYSARPWTDLAQALVGAHRLPEARAAAERALAIDPGSRAARDLLSRASKPR